MNIIQIWYFKPNWIWDSQPFFKLNRTMEITSPQNHQTPLSSTRARNSLTASTITVPWNPSPTTYASYSRIAWLPLSLGPRVYMSRVECESTKFKLYPFSNLWARAQTQVWTDTIFQVRTRLVIINEGQPVYTSRHRRRMQGEPRADVDYRAWGPQRRRKTYYNQEQFDGFFFLKSS